MGASIFCSDVQWIITHMRAFVTILAMAAVALSQSTAPYIGGNQFGNYYTNPNLINTFLSQINSNVNPACNAIAGVGQPILAIKQVLQSIDTQLDVSNRDSNVKMIFLRERKNNATYQTNYKLVLQIKNFASNNYVAIEGVYKQVGYPTFEVLTYYFDSNLDNIRSVLGEYTVDPNGFVSCGDLKAIYSQASSTLPKSNQTPYKQGNTIVNAAPVSQDKVDPAVVAQVIQLLQRQ